MGIIMKKYLIVGMLCIGICLGQTIDDLNTEQKLRYNRNKLSIDIVQKTLGGVVGNNYGSESWNQWTAHKGLGNKITEYEFFAIAGYKNEAKNIKEEYIKSKSKVVNSLLMMGASVPLFFIGGSLIGNVHVTPKEERNLGYTMMIGGFGLGAVGLVKFMLASPSLRNNSVPYSAVKPIMEEYNKNLIKDIINNKK
jgi:hypothetical protein